MAKADRHVSQPMAGFKSGQQAKFDALPDKRKQVPERRIAAREGKKPPRWETLPAQAWF